MTRRSIIAILASLFIALCVTVQSAAASIAPSVDGSSCGFRFLEANTTMLPVISPSIGPSVVTADQWRFIENNTTNLPNAVTAEMRRVSTGDMQRFIDENTTWLPVGAGAAPAAMTGSQWRFVEVNTTMLPHADMIYPYAEGLTPPLGVRR